jgi:hypothetical protein
MLHLALFYEPIDLWLAFYITMDYVTVQPLTHTNYMSQAYIVLQLLAVSKTVISI